MIVSFSVSNFRSFSSEQTFSLVASHRLSGSHEDHAISIPGSSEKVLKIGVLYGANGAGKSNLFKALRYLKSVALHLRTKSTGTGREAFCLGSRSDEPSTFDLQFVIADKLYRFGFKVDDQRITEEWLLEVIGSRERVLYERTTTKDGNVSVEAHWPPGTSPKLAALTTVGGPQNQSFLATLQTTLEKSDLGEELSSILFWFNNSLTFVAPNAPFKSLGAMLATDTNFKDFTNDFLKSSSTGVDSLQIEKQEITEAELYNILPEGMLPGHLERLRYGRDTAATIRLGDGSEIMLEATPDNHYYKIAIQAAHAHPAGHFVPLDLKEESDGTRRLINLLPALYGLHASTQVYVIDEVDRSMHPALVWKFLEFFLRSPDTRQRQIIVTTHESHLLDLDLLRRDEIWFAEKDSSASTHLYPLTDFKVRKDLEIRKHYLQGRFGAVPFLGNIEQLLADPI